LIDIGDRLTSLGARSGNYYEIQIQSTTEIKDFRDFFGRDPPFVDIELDRIDALDDKYLPVMPVPAMTGPFERIRREIRVVEAGSNRSQAQEANKYPVLEISAPNVPASKEAVPVTNKEASMNSKKDGMVDVGLHFLKVRLPVPLRR
jgi:hypothetical protein